MIISNQIDANKYKQLMSWLFLSAYMYIYVWLKNMHHIKLICLFMLKQLNPNGFLYEIQINLKFRPKYFLSVT